MVSTRGKKINFIAEDEEEDDDEEMTTKREFCPVPVTSLPEDTFEAQA